MHRFPQIKNILELITACAFTQCDLQGVAAQLSRYDWRLRAHYLNRTMRARCYRRGNAAEQ
jgi:hypothetical protein